MKSNFVPGQYQILKKPYWTMDIQYISVPRKYELDIKEYMLPK
jgi:hypothetical protein